MENLTNEQIVAILSALLILAEAIVRVTPTERDNSILNGIKKIWDIILPNIKKDGGRFI